MVLDDLYSTVGEKVVENCSFPAEICGVSIRFPSYMLNVHKLSREISLELSVLSPVTAVAPIPMKSRRDIVFSIGLAFVFLSDLLTILFHFF